MDFKLTKADMRILEVLWKSDKPLTYCQIVEIEPSLNINTVQTQLRKLLKNEYVKVADITYSGTVLCRCYEASMTEEELATGRYVNELSKMKKRPLTSSLVCNLLDMESSKEQKLEDINELEKMLEEYKRNL